MSARAPRAASPTVTPRYTTPLYALPPSLEPRSSYCFPLGAASRERPHVPSPFPPLAIATASWCTADAAAWPPRARTCSCPAVSPRASPSRVQLRRPLFPLPGTLQRQGRTYHARAAVPPPVLPPPRAGTTITPPCCPAAPAKARAARLTFPSCARTQARVPTPSLAVAMRHRAEPASPRCCPAVAAQRRHRACSRHARSFAVPCPSPRPAAAARARRGRAAPQRPSLRSAPCTPQPPMPEFPRSTLDRQPPHFRPPAPVPARPSPLHLAAATLSPSVSRASHLEHALLIRTGRLAHGAALPAPQRHRLPRARAPQPAREHAVAGRCSSPVDALF
ncbi:vegetative cell wall protein gp1-like [Miscanthus floridulus]|uniref:vegetative cell wall protein gp1-like n=1 Tax=Miscanthus floridulus TaxID=154761 RepID=UPI00345AB28D